jgi:hypothetical protein
LKTKTEGLTPPVGCTAISSMRDMTRITGSACGYTKAVATPHSKRFA